jgi:hypothetical protein
MLESLDTLIAFVLIMLVVSMLITIAVQILAAAFNLRGINLARGLTQTFNTILPGFEDQAKNFADCILCGRLLSDSSVFRSFRRKATAVRPDEVFDALHRIATGRRDIPELRENARRLLQGLGLPEGFLDDAAAQVEVATGMVQRRAATVQELKEAAGATIAHLPPDQQARAQAVITALTNRLDAFETVAANKADVVTQAVEAAYKKFQYWFEVSQERAQQWFTSHTRWFTIVFAIIFAFWLQLDTVEIFKLVSSNRAVRDALVAQSTNVIKQADKILGESPSVLQQALKTWRDNLTDENARKAVEGENASPTDTRSSLREHIQKKLKAASVPKIDELLTALNNAIDAAAQESLKESAQQFSEVKLDLDHTGFALFPVDGKGRWGKTWSDGFWPHFWGMIFSAGLLSLGAPFWFNALRSLASLRTKVAENITSEKEGKKKPPGAAAEEGETAAPATTTN